MIALTSFYLPFAVGSVFFPKSEAIVAFPPSFANPSTLVNYYTVINRYLPGLMWNGQIAALSTLLVLAISSMAAYAFAHGLCSKAPVRAHHRHDVDPDPGL